MVGGAVTQALRCWQQFCQERRIDLLSGKRGTHCDRAVHSKGWKGAVTTEADQVKGRFAEFLPRKYPSLEEQQKAMELLRQLAQEVRHERGEERGHMRGSAA